MKRLVKLVLIGVLAVGYIQNISAQEQDPVDQLYLEACQDSRKNRFDDALNKLQSILNNYPEHAIITEILYSIATVYILRMDYISRDFPDVMNIEGGWLEKKKELYHNAMEYYMKVINNYPESRFAPLSLYHLASCHHDLAGINYQPEGYDIAIATFTEILTRYPDCTNPTKEEVFFNIGRCYFMKRDYDNSILWFKKIQTEFPSGELCIDTWDYLAEIYFKKKDYTNALYAYETIFSLTPPPEKCEMDSLVYTIATLYVYLKEYDVAINKLEEFISDYPDSQWIDDAYYGIGLVYLEQNKYAEAEDIFWQIIELNSEYAAAWDGLAIIRLEQGNIDEAEKYSKKAYELNSAEDGIKLTRGRVYYYRGDMTRAYYILKSSLAKRADEIGGPLENSMSDYEQALGNYYLGLCCIKKGKIQEAIEALNRAIELDLDGEISEKARQELEKIQ